MGEIESDRPIDDKMPNQFAAGVHLADLTGRQVGRYLVQRQLGSGGVAMVYQAYDQVQGITVALKVLLPGADEKTHGRFRREALTAGALRHPHIVRILQVGTALQGEIAYIAMELVEGESLADLLASRGRLRPEESCNLLEPIARALHYAHAAGFVHRDVKPSNILLRPAGPNTPDAVQLETLDHPMIPLLSDFGIARAIDSPELTSTGRTVGTPAYMAPEQCAGRRDADGRADVYSLGAVLYRCVVGHTPFSGTTTQILHAHVYEPLTIDDDLLNQLPYSIVSILQRSLAKKPEERYATAEQMAEELARSAGRSAPRAIKPANAIGASEATGTLTTGTQTLTSLPADATTSRTHSTTVLVPAPGPALPSRTQQIIPNATAALPVRSAARPVPMSTLVSGLMLLLLGLVFVIALVFFVVNGSPFRANQGAVRLPTVTIPGTLIPGTLPTTAGVPSGGVNAQTSTATPVQMPTTTPIEVAPSPTLTPLPAPTDTPLPTATPPPAPSPTEVIVPTDTPAPIDTPTVVVLPSPTFVPTAPTPPPDGEIVVACTTMPDERLGLPELDPALRDALGCAKEATVETPAQSLRFQNGLMVYLEAQSELYVYYNADQGWFMVSLIIEGGEQGDAEGAPPPAPDLFVPKGVFGVIWQRQQLQLGLGYATQPEPEHFSAIKQAFNGGTVIGNPAEPQKVSIFLKTKEQ